MKQIKIKISERKKNCDIFIENDLIKKIPELLNKKYFGKKIAIVTDSNVQKLYGTALNKALIKAGFRTCLINFIAGEKNKNWLSAEKILNKFFDFNLNRDDLVIALGGGVAGDLAGFVSSIYQRGVKLIHMPTTLLAMVDSSIGGKTGINNKYGKNMVGTFYQPEAIYIDPKLLQSLPINELRTGFAEVIKYGVIANLSLFCLLEKHYKKLLSYDNQFLNKIIIQSCQIKAHIIAKDEKENSLRMILNYGHTFGHAIEALSKYKINHGHGVAYGMLVINKISQKLELIDKRTEQRIKNLITSFLDIGQLPSFLAKKSEQEKLWSLTQNDKKVRKSKINFIIIQKIGKARIYDKITKSDFQKIFND